MRVFVTTVDCGSQIAAANRLDMSRPVVSRFLADLEEWAGTRLLHRTTRRLSLTPVGEEMLPRCRQVLEQVDQMRDSLNVCEETPKGQLRITVSTSFGQTHLAPAIADYLKLHPGVSVDLVLLDRTVNLIDERIDLAIRIAAEIDPNLIARKLADCHSVVCASPAYLDRRGVPLHPEQLARHDCLTHSHFSKSLWHFEHVNGPLAVAVEGRISANDVGSLLQGVRAGLGVSMLPTFLVAPYLRTGELKALLPDYQPKVQSIFAVYASRKHRSAALRTMLDFLIARFARPEWLN